MNCRLKLFLLIAAVICVIPTLAQAQSCWGYGCTITCTGGICEGTDGNDVICGSSYDDEIRGGFGADIICGFGGNDWLKGGWGEDYLFGGTDIDTLWGGHCDDYLDAGDGTDPPCLGGQGFDTFGGVSGCEIQDQGSTSEQGDNKNGDRCPSFFD